MSDTDRQHARILYILVVPAQGRECGMYRRCEGGREWMDVQLDRRRGGYSDVQRYNDESDTESNSDRAWNTEQRRIHRGSPESWRRGQTCDGRDVDEWEMQRYAENPRWEMDEHRN